MVNVWWLSPLESAESMAEPIDVITEQNANDSAYSLPRRPLYKVCLCLNTWHSHFFVVLLFIYFLYRIFYKLVNQVLDFLAE